MKKILILLIVIILCIANSLYLKNKTIISSLQDLINKSDNIIFEQSISAFSDNHPRMIYVDDYQNVDSVEELYEKSDLVAKVSLKGREQPNNVLVAELNVIHTFKGQGNLTNIYLYEPATVSSFYSEIHIYGSQKLIEKDKEYIVFLQQALPEDGHYYNYLNTCLSLYPIQHTLNIKNILSDDLNVVIDKNDVEKYDFFDIKFSSDIIDDLISQEDKSSLENYYNQISHYSEFAKIILNKEMNDNIKINADY